MDQKKPKRGGARLGAGRKPLDLGEKQVDDLIKAFKRAGKEKKTSAGQELARIAFSGENDRVKLKALDIYYKCVAVRKSLSKTEIHQITGPVIGLPPVLPRPQQDEDKEQESRELH